MSEFLMVGGSLLVLTAVLGFTRHLAERARRRDRLRIVPPPPPKDDGDPPPPPPEAGA